MSAFSVSSVQTKEAVLLGFDFCTINGVTKNLVRKPYPRAPFSLHVPLFLVQTGEFSVWFLISNSRGDKGKPKCGRRIPRPFCPRFLFSPYRKGRFRMVFTAVRLWVLEIRCGGLTRRPLLVCVSLLPRKEERSFPAQFFFSLLRRGPDD